MTALKHLCQKHDCFSNSGIESCHVSSFYVVRFKCLKQRGVHIACITAHSVTKGPVLYLDSGGRISHWLKASSPIWRKPDFSEVGHGCITVHAHCHAWWDTSLLKPSRYFYDMWPAQILHLSLTIFELNFVSVKMTSFHRFRWTFSISGFWVNSKGQKDEFYRVAITFSSGFNLTF